MNPTLIKYGLTALAFVGWTGIVSYGVADYKERGYRAAIAEQKAEAEKTLREANEKTAQENERHAQIAINTDAMYQELINSAYAGRDDFANRLRFAREAGRGKSCGNVVPGQASTTGVGQEPAGSGELGLGQAPAIDPILQARDGVKQIIASLRSCHQWAVSVGR